MASEESALEAALGQLPAPVKSLHETLTAMGFASLLSLNSLRQTGGSNIDAAMEWIETHQDRAEASSVLLPATNSSAAAASVLSAMASLSTMGVEHKMMLVVRDDLGMSAGKVRRAVHARRPCARPASLSPA
jgi:uncharacterized UBP type Zn finger protein